MKRKVRKCPRCGREHVDRGRLCQACRSEDEEKARPAWYWGDFEALSARYPEESAESIRQHMQCSVPRCRDLTKRGSQCSFSGRHNGFCRLHWEHGREASNA